MQNVSILAFIGAKDKGGNGDNWSYETRKAPVKSKQKKLIKAVIQFRCCINPITGPECSE